jgi:DNA-binding transcriptional regulator/RsmH inhibitor MraZ
MIVGVLDKIEIWNRERWVQFSAQERDPEDYAAKLAELGIRV